VVRIVASENATVSDHTDEQSRLRGNATRALMRELSVGEAVYFADAVHPEYQVNLLWMGEGWGQIRACAHHSRNVAASNTHGALNLETFDAPFVEPTTVDGVSAVQLLQDRARILTAYSFTSIWDNALHKGRMSAFF